MKLSGLEDCADYFIAVKAFNSAGLSDEFSNEVKGWARPGVTSVTPSNGMQGEQLVLDIMGNNFQEFAVVDLGNPHIYVNSVDVVSCNHIQLLATIEPNAARARPAQIGALNLTVVNPDSVFGQKRRR